MWRAQDRLSQTTQMAWERSRNIIRKRQVCDQVEGLPDSTRETVTAWYAYVERHRDPLDDAQDKALGLPMGRGMVARACKWRIQQRFKGVGMRWSEAGFHPLFHRRLAWVNGAFEVLFQVQLPPSPNT